MDRDTTVALTSAIVRGTPSLPEAACRGAHELFDDVPGQSRQSYIQRRESFAAAVILCQGCLARPACSVSRPGKTPLRDAL